MSELTKKRSKYLLENIVKTPYTFLGVTNGVSAVNVVAGGDGRVGPYIGGWQSNAMKNRLGMCLPDTLHVSCEEPSAQAKEINHHLKTAFEVNQDNRYQNMCLLADLEQGWGSIHKTRMAVKKCIESGVSLVHIEDQSVEKRCGHLGDKELASLEDYESMLKAARIAASEMDLKKNEFMIVGRTDAYSAKRIQWSAEIMSPNHPEHEFVDWTKEAKGKYLYLKEGCGLELAIARMSRVLDLVDFVWMETPDFNKETARLFMERMRRVNSDTRGLYNFSPSFDWTEAENLHSFSDDLFEYGYVLHLITLPEFHVMAYHMFCLSDSVRRYGIQGYVENIQKKEKELMNRDKRYTYLCHQRAVGVGIEAEFARRIGHANVNALSESTEKFS